MSDQQPLTSVQADSQNVITPSDAPQQTAPAVQTSPVDKSTAAKPFNLHESEDFRRVQANYERQKADLQRRLQAEQEARRQAELRGLDEYEQQVKMVQYENQTLKEQLEAVRMEREMLAAEQARRDYLATVSRKTGAPLEILESAQGPDDVWGLAWDYAQSKAQKPQPAAPKSEPPASWTQAQQKMTAQAEQAFVPDLGGGGSTAPSNAEQMLADAQRLNNPVLYLQALRKLREEGK